MEAPVLFFIFYLSFLRIAFRSTYPKWIVPVRPHISVNGWPQIAATRPVPIRRASLCVWRRIATIRRAHLSLCRQDRTPGRELWDVSVWFSARHCRKPSETLRTGLFLNRKWFPSRFGLAWFL